MRGAERIDLSRIDADASQAGDQAFAWIGANPFTGRVGELRCQRGIVGGDLDGDGQADFEIAVAGQSKLAAADFVL